MADIFNSLAEQTLGHSTVIQPLAASRFGPTPTTTVDMPFRFPDEQGPFLPPALVEEVASEASDPPFPLISPDDPRVAAPLPTFQQMIQSVVSAQDGPEPAVVQPHNIFAAHPSVARAESVTLPDTPPHDMPVEAIFPTTHPAHNLLASQTIMQASATPATHPQPPVPSVQETPDNNIRPDAEYASGVFHTAVPLPPDRSIAPRPSSVEAQAERVIRPTIPNSAMSPAHLPFESPARPAPGNVVQLQAASAVTSNTLLFQAPATSEAVIHSNGLVDDLPVGPVVNQAKATPPADLESQALPAIHAPQSSRRRAAVPADRTSEPASRRQPDASTPQLSALTAKAEVLDDTSRAVYTSTPRPPALTATDLQAETIKVAGQTEAEHIVPLAHEMRVEAAMRPQAQALSILQTPDNNIQPVAEYASGVSHTAAIPVPVDRSVASLLSPVEAQAERVIRPATGNAVQLQAASASITPDILSFQADATSVAVVHSSGQIGDLPESPPVHQANTTPPADSKSPTPPATHASRNPRRRAAAPADRASGPASPRQPEATTLKPSALALTDLQAETIKVASHTEAAHIFPLAHDTGVEAGTHPQPSAASVLGTSIRPDADHVSVISHMAVPVPPERSIAPRPSPVEGQAERVIRAAIPNSATPPAHLPSESVTQPAMGNVVPSQTTLADIAPGAQTALAQTISTARPSRTMAALLQQNAKSSQEDEEPIAPRLAPVALSSSAPTESMTTHRLPSMASEALPTISVTIGRIEVRTTPAPSTPVAPRSRPAQPALSLKEYLKQGQSKKS